MGTRKPDEDEVREEMRRILDADPDRDSITYHMTTPGGCLATETMKKKRQTKAQEIEFNDGYKWVGGVVDGKMHGKGKFTLPGGKVLNLEFNMGMDVREWGMMYTQHGNMILAEHTEPSPGA